MESLIVFPLFFSNALLPVFTALYTSRSESLIRWYEGSFRFLIIIGLPFVIVVTVLANNFVRLLFGKGFADSTIVLQLLIWATFFISLNTILSHLLIATDRQRLNVITYGMGAICTVISGLILIPLLSYTGAAISLLIGQILVFATAFYLICRNLFRISLIHLTVKPFVSSFLMGSLIFFFKEWNIILGVFFGILFYIGFLCLFRAIDREDMALLRDILWQGQ
jgi:O-antigen/teichoic acid export membrane protein